MGKYMRKSKPAGDVAVMDLAQSSLGVRTRAKTLALQRLQQSAAAAGSYLQLRSRKLEKPPLPAGAHRQRQTGLRLGNPSPNCKTRASSKLRVSSQSVKENHQPVTEKLEDGDEIGNDGVGDSDGNIEAFIGENSPEHDGRDRTTRESTPCSFIRGPDHVGTPGSATRASSSVESSKRMQNSVNRLMPTAKEMEEFFAGAEQQQHRQFIEKYNFDPVKEKPLPGRYAWEKVDP
uniref:Cyclin-dependent kinase inhibitor domain-containing protein n=1 Tax=Kalanchoe fedtschenkoi TaxID=63787 RepID=A0A7N0V898_KALFE